MKDKYFEICVSQFFHLFINLFILSSILQGCTQPMQELLVFYCARQFVGLTVGSPLPFALLLYLRGIDTHTLRSHTQTHLRQSLSLLVHLSFSFIYSPACLVHEKLSPCSLVSPLGGALPRCHPELATCKSQRISVRNLFFSFCLSLLSFPPPSLPPSPFGRRCDVSLNAPLANFCHIYTRTIGVKIETGPQLTLTHAMQHQAEAPTAFCG